MELYLDPVQEALAPSRQRRRPVAPDVVREAQAPEDLAPEDLASPARLRAAHLATRATLAFSDACALGVAALVHVALGGALGLPGPGTEAVGLAALFAGVLVVRGFYRGSAMHPATEVRGLVLSVLGVTAGGAAAAVLLGHTGPEPVRMALFGVTAGLALPAGRLASRLAWSRTGWWGVPALVIASRSVAPAVVDTLRRWPELGLRPVALLLDGDEGGGDGAAPLPPALPVWGRPEQGPVFARAFGIPLAVVALPGRAPRALAQELGQFTRFFERVLVMNCAPGARALWTALPAPEGLLGYCVGGGAGRGYAVVKRTLDLAGALLGLVLLAPLFAVLAVLVRLDSPGPVLFRQRRMGRDGRCFHVFKFRTMHADAEHRLATMLDVDPSREAEYRAYHKLLDDPRVTPAGQWLRRFSFDELPQLWNVLRGEMSLVGPRAYIPVEIRDMEGLERVVLQTRPGLTGLWQVSGRNALSFTARVEVDVHYVQNASPWLDLYILARTIPVALTGEGAS